MSLLKLRTRLKNIKGLSEIFSAIQVITLVRLQKAKVMYSSVCSYIKPIEETLKGRVADIKLSKKVLVVITSNRGLCGAFNNSVISKAFEFAASNPDIDLVFIGKRGYEAWQKKSDRTGKVLFFEIDSADRPDFQKISLFFKKIFDTGREIYVAANVYKSAVIQVPVINKIYPFPEELARSGENDDIILEPDRRTLIDSLFYHYLEARFFRIIMDSQVGEQSARLMLLKGAVDSSKDLIEELTLSINKVRQAAITRDLLEIVSSAEALKKEAKSE